MEWESRGSFISSGSHGVRRRAKEFHLEVRTQSRGCSKVHATFGRDRGGATMAHDVVKLCCLGEPKFLAQGKGKLNFCDRRSDVVEFLRGDARMERLADTHRQKDTNRENWDEGMKKTLREVASDALRQLGYGGQEGAAAQAVDSQNMNDGYGDEEPSFNIHAVFDPGNGDAPINGPQTKEAQRNIPPKLPDLSLVRELSLPELDMDQLLQGDTAQEAAEPQAVDSQSMNVGYVDEEPSFDIDAVLGRRNSDARINRLYTKEAQRSILPELELSLEDLLDMALNQIDRLEAENKMLKEGHGLQYSGNC